MKPVVKFGLVFTGFSIIACLFYLGLRSGSAPTVATYAAEPSVCNDVGTVCQLIDKELYQGVNWIPTATDARSYDEFKKYLNADDREGLKELLSSGRLLNTKSGDHIRVLDVSAWDERTEGRMVSGQYAGQHVWTARKWVVH